MIHVAHLSVFDLHGGSDSPMLCPGFWRVRFDQNLYIWCGCVALDFVMFLAFFVGYILFWHVLTFSNGPCVATISWWASYHIALTHMRQLRRHWCQSSWEQTAGNLPGEGSTRNPRGLLLFFHSFCMFLLLYTAAIFVIYCYIPLDLFMLMVLCFLCRSFCSPCFCLSL